MLCPKAENWPMPTPRDVPERYPLPARQDCPENTTCRVKACCSAISPDVCIFDVLCLEKPPKLSHTGICSFGDPILVMRNDTLQDIHCGPRSPCPKGTYCNTELMDTYSTCCLSDPNKPVKPGVCPTSKNASKDFCVDTCKNDGDCSLNNKCCDNGCKKECLPPKLDNDRDEKDKPVKPGVCPTSNNASKDFCVDTCKNDGDCRLNDKCCDNGCKKECLPPKLDNDRDEKEKPPKLNHTGICPFGDPISVNKNGTLQAIHCGPRSPCPNGTYCNTELNDTYSTCCPSDPNKPVKPGVCPTSNNASKDFCVDTCKNDGDCRLKDKCCDNGCKKECLPPKLDNGRDEKEKPPKLNHTGICPFGDPVLVNKNGTLQAIHCGPRSPCPNGTYCNTELNDTYSTCCPSDPKKPPKLNHTGICPFGDPISVNKNGTLQAIHCGPRSPCPNGTYCNTELNDTYSTCCPSDPKKPPELYHTGICPFGDPISVNRNGTLQAIHCGPRSPCPNGTYCNTELDDTYSTCCPSDPRSKKCPPVCKIHCPWGKVKDSNDCPICRCKLPSRRRRKNKHGIHWPMPHRIRLNRYIIQSRVKMRMP
ncbi:wap four-disulfide core domain protein 3 [Plakobranchus ocellatus]|uniref:Wap four-disulfide core domain protein 3 n=1 Tax=Plakobranchus ocellatus TaxID=259542 RepID=A0AAV3YUQ3_9GAST|nr:wap four-disulfide core domain protein 3 [Plakobranchus ocellatus]